MDRTRLLKFFLSFCCVCLPLAAEENRLSPSEYTTRDFSHLIGMEGFSDELLKIHFTLYQGYVTQTNQLSRLLGSYVSATEKPDYAYQALKRRFSFEFDGMRLHELYFENLGGKDPLDPQSALFKRIVKDFGSYEAWKGDFVATGMMRGIGWAILYLDPKSGRLFNSWISEHETGHLAAGVPILVMDVWEHAYMVQYRLDKAKYIEAFLNNIDWSKPGHRWQEAFRTISR